MRLDYDLPNRPVRRLIEPVLRFLHIEAAGGLALFCCTVVALLIANSPLASSYHAFWNQSSGITFGNSSMSYPLWYWVNDVLMVVFFFVIGLEIKRELTTGELSEKRRIVLPVAAAIGGAVTPAIIFLMIQQGQSGQNGWAIPIATDIAFVVGAISLLGKRVPHSLKIFLLSVAIVDDLLAVSVIAIFYTETIHLSWVIISLSGFGAIFLLNRLGVRAISVYVAVGCGIWFSVHNAGIHPTIAGVILGLMTPSGSLMDRNAVQTAFTSLGSAFSQTDDHTVKDGAITMSRVAQFTARESVAPLERLEKGLHPWVAFAIMPLFALANAAVSFQNTSLGDSLSMAVIVGLVIGKPLGILVSSYAVVGFNWTKLPERLTWPVMIGAGFLSGVGFTMSLFSASLGLDGSLLEIAKGGVIIGSAASILLGCGMLLILLPGRESYRNQENVVAEMGPE